MHTTHPNDKVSGVMHGVNSITKVLVIVEVGGLPDTWNIHSVIGSTFQIHVQFVKP